MNDWMNEWINEWESNYHLDFYWNHRVQTKSPTLKEVASWSIAVNSIQKLINEAEPVMRSADNI